MSWQRRCTYIDESGLQCETWFSFDETQTDQRLCQAHSELITPSRAAQDTEIKVQYIDLVNSKRVEVYKMSFDEIDAHVLSLEKELEQVKIALYTTRAVKREKLEQLSEEERKQLRAIKVEKSVTSDKVKVPSIKADPVAHLMKKHNLTEAQAKALLGI